jgi:hypothetical protein
MDFGDKISGAHLETGTGSPALITSAEEQSPPTESASENKLETALPDDQSNAQKDLLSDEAKDTGDVDEGRTNETVETTQPQDIGVTDANLNLDLKVQPVYILPHGVASGTRSRSEIKDTLESVSKKLEEVETGKRKRLRSASERDRSSSRLSSGRHSRASQKSEVTSSDNDLEMSLTITEPTSVASAGVKLNPAPEKDNDPSGQTELDILAEKLHLAEQKLKRREEQISLNKTEFDRRLDSYQIDCELLASQAKQAENELLRCTAESLSKETDYLNQLKTAREESYEISKRIKVLAKDKDEEVLARKMTEKEARKHMTLVEALKHDLEKMQEENKQLQESRSRLGQPVTKPKLDEQAGGKTSTGLLELQSLRDQMRKLQLEREEELEKLNLERQKITEQLEDSHYDPPTPKTDDDLPWVKDSYGLSVHPRDGIYRPSRERAERPARRNDGYGSGFDNQYNDYQGNRRPQRGGRNNGNGGNGDHPPPNRRNGRPPGRSGGSGGPGGPGGPGNGGPGDGNGGPGRPRRNGDRTFGESFNSTYGGQRLRYSDGLPRKFDGTGKIQAKAYLRSLQDYFSLQNITDDWTKISRMQITLENHARLWMDEQKADMSYNELEVEFLKQFTGTVSYESNLNKFRGCKWREDQPLDNYKQKLIMFAEMIGCDRDRRGYYSKELKTQFKLGLPSEYQMALGDLTEDDSLDTIVKRTQKHWDLRQLNQMQAATVTVGDTSSGLTMLAAQEKAKEPELESREATSPAFAVTSNSSRRYSPYRNNSKGRYRSQSRGRYQGSYSGGRPRSLSRGRSPGRYRTGTSHYTSNEQQDKYYNNNRESQSSYASNYGNQNNYQQSRYNSYGNYNNENRDGRSPDRRSRNYYPGRNGEKSRSRSRGRNDTPGPPGEPLICHHCKIEGHKIRDCYKLYEAMQAKFGNKQSFPVSQE